MKGTEQQDNIITGEAILAGESLMLNIRWILMRHITVHINNSMDIKVKTKDH